MGFYEEEAIEYGLVTKPEDGTIVSNIKLTEEEAMTEEIVEQPSAPPPPPISECKDVVVTVNAPQKALKYDPKKDAELKIKLDSVFGAREVQMNSWCKQWALLHHIIFTKGISRRRFQMI